MIEFSFPERVDLMSHTADILDIDITLVPYNTIGKPDKRFKSGWRVFPSNGVNVIVNHIIVQRKDQYKMNQFWNVGKMGTEKDLGRFAVSQIGPDSVKLIPASLSQNKDHLNLKFSSKMEFLYFGSYYMEGTI